MDDSHKVAAILTSVEGCCPPPKQKRALQTREDLIRAAREVFAQDGFEYVRIEDIAARAGKTRGAFYANFDDKEDVFFAIFEEDLLRDQQRVRPSLRAATTTDQRIEAITDDLIALLQDRQRTLLNLEFKMYVIRHPQKQKRLTELHSAMLLRCCMTKIDNFLPELADLTYEDKRKRALGLAVILDGSALNRLFDPANLTDEQLRRYVRLGVAETMRIEKEQTADDE